MRILLIHADHFEYELKKEAIREPEEISPHQKRGSEDEVLVVFSTAEKGDGQDEALVATKTADAVEEATRSVQTKNVLIYPYAHLSSELAQPKVAMSILRKVTTELEKRGLNVSRSPFGWYKSFKISCKGHPLSELSRTITPIKGGERKTATGMVKNYYKILDPDMKLHDPASYTFDASQRDIRVVSEKEALKRELTGGREPLYLKYCRKFGIQWEPFSDVGHMRYNPEGTLLFDLVSDYARALVNSLGIPVFHVRGTNLFDLSVPAVREHADLYGARLYQIDIDEKSYVLRYAACHQQFAMVKDWILSYKDLPMGAFEIADSYRMEQDGELLLCFRVRKLHMPDLHIFCKDLDEAEGISLDVHKRIYSEIRKLGLDYVSLYNTTELYFKEHQDFFKRLLDIEGKPVLINFVPELYYWTINVEYNIVDELQRPREIGTFQIDVGNAKRFDITYANEKGTKQYPSIIHTALIGTIERYLFAVFDAVARDEQSGKPTMLPVWLSPTQIRVVPLSKQFFDFAEKTADFMEKAGIRVDIDDIDETLSKKIRRAETSWVPFVAVVGEKEQASGKLAVRIRRNTANKEMTPAELVATVKSETDGYPTRPFPLPRYLSRRPGYKTD